MVKTIKVSDETHQRIKNQGKMGNTMEDVIKRLLDNIEKED
jgi:predicted CopG family antitoxin